MLIIFLILVIIAYIVPAFIAYLGIRHSFKTKYNSLQPGIDDMLMVFLPLLNWGMAVFVLLNTAFESMDKISDKVDNSRTNQEIRKRKIGSKFFRL